jgi:hypothetical protein
MCSVIAHVSHIFVSGVESHTLVAVARLLSPSLRSTTATNPTTPCRQPYAARQGQEVDPRDEGLQRGGPERVPRATGFGGYRPPSAASEIVLHNPKCGRAVFLSHSSAVLRCIEDQGWRGASTSCATVRCYPACQACHSTIPRGSSG